MSGPYAPLYAEAAAARRRWRGQVTHVVGRQRLTDVELAAYLGSVLDRRPEASCVQEREVALWLLRYVIAEDRWFLAWQRAVCARDMAKARAELPPGPIPRLWLG